MTEQIKSIIQTLNASQVRLFSRFSVCYTGIVLGLLVLNSYISSMQGGELDTTEGMSPLDVVVRILNNQLSSLMWIDEKVNKFYSSNYNFVNIKSLCHYVLPDNCLVCCFEL